VKGFKNMKVIKIGAVWCPGCLVMKPRWEEVEKENSWLKAEYLDFDNDKEKVKEYNIKDDNLPVFIFLDKGGKELLRLSGELSKKEIIKTITELKDK
jgi:thiol-disulfide isomerase/thioredoxin